MTAGIVTVAALSVSLVGVTPIVGQAQTVPQEPAVRTAPTAGKIPTPGQFPPYAAPRTADGKPELNGIWQALVTADVDLQVHDAQPGPHPDVGAWKGFNCVEFVEKMMYGPYYKNPSK